MSSFSSIPTPEQVQYLLGIHPAQAAATAALGQASQGPAMDEAAPTPGAEESETGGENSGDSGGNSGESEGKTEKPEGNSGKAEAAPAPTAPSSLSAGVARPPTGPRGLGGTVGPPVPELTPDLTAGSTSPDLTNVAQPTLSTRPISSAQARANTDQERTARDQAALDEARAKPAGVVQFQHHHRILGPLVRGLEIAGTVVAPHVMAQIPGTTLNRAANLNRMGANVKEDLATEKESGDIANKQEVDAIRRQAEEDRKTNQQNTEAERERHNQEIESIRRELNEAKNPEALEQAKIKARTNTADQVGLKGAERQRYILYGDKSAMDDYRSAQLGLAEERIGLMQDRLNLAQDKENREAGKQAAGQHTFKDSAAVDKYSDQWYEKERKDVLAEKAKVAQTRPDASEVDLQPEYKRIEDEYAKRAQQFEGQKKQWYGEISSGRPVTVNESEGQVPTSATGAGAGRGNATGAPAQRKKGDALGGTNSATNKPYAVGDPINVNGETLYVKDFNAATGKPILTRTQPQ